jgi:hypothetical protein
MISQGPRRGFTSSDPALLWGLGYLLTVLGGCAGVGQTQGSTGATVQGGTAQVCVFCTSESTTESALQKSDLSIQLAPRVVQYVYRYKDEGVTIRQNEYGFGVIVRARNNGKTIEHLKALEVGGDIDTDPSDLQVLGGEERTFEEIFTEYERRKPYYRVSFVLFPININKVEPGSEEFIRFMLLDPTNLSTQAIVRGDDAHKYVGFRGENPAVPILLTTVPNIRSFVTFTQSEHKVPGNAQLLGPRLRHEVKSGQVKFSLKFESGSHIIGPQGIQNPTLMLLEDWNKQTPQDIYFKNNIWDRAYPVTKDPLMETLR